MSINLHLYFTTILNWLSCQITWISENVNASNLIMAASGFLLFPSFPIKSQDVEKTSKFFGRAQQGQLTRGRGISIQPSANNDNILTAALWGSSPHSQLKPKEIPTFFKFIWVVLLQFLANIHLLLAYTRQWLQKISGYVIWSWADSHGEVADPHQH